MPVHAAGAGTQSVGVDKFQGNIVQLRPAGNLFGGPPQLCVVVKPILTAHSRVTGEADVETTGITGGAGGIRHKIICIAQN